MGKPSKQFWDERSKKLNKKRRRNTIRNPYTCNRKVKHRQGEFRPDYVINVPECFSLIVNLENTVLFFSNVIKQFKDAAPRSNFLIESRSVVNVTTDAIMYLIALMRNHRDSRWKMHSFYGTYPVNNDAKKIYMESGLF